MLVKSVAPQALLAEVHSGPPGITKALMTPRTIRRLAFGIALAVQTGMVVTYGTITDWCFCSVTGSPEPPIPPLFMMLFLELAVLPAAWETKGHAVQMLFVLNLGAWFFAMRCVLDALVLTARVRIRPVLGDPSPRRRIWLAPREGVRPIHVILAATPFVAALAIGGAMQRRAWLMEADRVFAATITAASANRSLPAGVEFSMYEWRDGDMARVNPDGRFAIEVDPRVSGDHFLDRLMVPYSYGGSVWFESGGLYNFVVYQDAGGWGVLVDDLPRRRRW